MTHVIPQSAATLKLFSVMIPWHAEQSEMGTFEDSAWAETGEEATRAIAEMMAEHQDSGCESDEEREVFADNLVSSGLAVVIAVEDTVAADLKRLLAGPDSTFGPAEEAKYSAILELLSIPHRG